MPDNEKTKDIEKRVEELEKEPEVKPENFVGIQRAERRIINDLEVLTIKNAATKALYGLLTNAQLTDLTDGGITTLHLPKAHKTTHQNGGADEISVAGLSGELADNQPPKTHALDSHSVPAGSIDMSNQTLFNLQDPGVGNATWAATKGYVDGSHPSVGSPSSRSANTVYLETTDGFVVGSVLVTGGTSPTVIFHSDTSNPPTTEVFTIAEGGANCEHSFCFPVKKDNRWKATVTGTMAIQVMNFIPFS